MLGGGGGLGEAPETHGKGCYSAVEEMLALNATPATPTLPPPPTITGCVEGQVDVSSAPPEELELIIHISSVRAAEILRLRPFRNYLKRWLDKPVLSVAEGLTTSGKQSLFPFVLSLSKDRTRWGLRF